MAHLHRLIAAAMLLLTTTMLNAQTGCYEYQVQTTVHNGVENVDISGWRSTREAWIDTIVGAYVQACNTNFPTGCPAIYIGAVEGGNLIVRNHAGGGSFQVYSSGFNMRERDCGESPKCPNDDNEVDKLLTPVIEGLSESSAKNIARTVATGQGGTCDHGCVVKRGRAACGGTGGTWRCELYEGSTTDKACTGTGFGTFNGTNFVTGTPTGSVGTPTQTTTAAPAGPGMCSGTFNGVVVYHKCADSTGNVTSTTTTTSGSGTLTVSSDGSTTCSGGACTTTKTITSTTTKPDGAGGTTSTSAVSTATVAESQDSFCKQNPKSSLCSESTVNTVSGVCNSFSCNGDAAMCAVAQATHQQKCMLEKSSPEADLYNSVKNNTGTFGIESQTLAISNQSFDQTDALGGGSCPSDKTFTVSGFGRTSVVTLPIASWCPFFTYAGWILVGASLLVAMRIVFRKA